MTKRTQNPREVAEIVAIQALSFVAGDPERLGMFLAETGIGPETLRSAAADPRFLAGVLDFVLRDDATVKAFAAASELDPTTIAAAREALYENPSVQPHQNSPPQPAFAGIASSTWTSRPGDAAYAVRLALFVTAHCPCSPLLTLIATPSTQPLRSATIRNLPTSL